MAQLKKEESAITNLTISPAQDTKKAIQVIQCSDFNEESSLSTLRKIFRGFHREKGLTEFDQCSLRRANDYSIL